MFETRPVRPLTETLDGRPRTVCKNWRYFWILFVLILFSRVSALSYHECVELFDTPEQGRYVCSDHSDLVPALQLAEREGREECERAFKDAAWNCSGFSLLKAPNVTSRITKEAAYVHALSLVAIAHSVAKLCTQGTASSCPCAEEDLTVPERESTVYQQTCSDNIDFGIQFAKNFLFKRHLGNTVKTHVEQHNMMIGAFIVRNRTVGASCMCRCIGISGSCTIQTCTSEHANLTVLGESIWSIYKDNTSNATMRYLSLPNDTQSTQEVREGMEISPVLIYTEESPDYCVQQPSYGSLGTAGRECDPHSTGLESCENLCTRCGRDHKVVQELSTETCYCEFVYCCEIHCHTCSRTREYYVCV